VKVFRSEDNEMFISAEREFNIMKRLAGHPHIVQGIDYIHEKNRGRGYLVMERVFGESVLQKVATRGRIHDEN
jgi:serine/threonine protein kinase